MDTSLRKDHNLLIYFKEVTPPFTKNLNLSRLRPQASISLN